MAGRQCAGLATVLKLAAWPCVQSIKHTFAVLRLPTLLGNAAEPTQAWDSSVQHVTPCVERVHRSQQAGRLYCLSQHFCIHRSQQAGRLYCLSQHFCIHRSQQAGRLYCLSQHFCIHRSQQAGRLYGLSQHFCRHEQGAVGATGAEHCDHFRHINTGSYCLRMIGRMGKGTIK